MAQGAPVGNEVKACASALHVECHREETRFKRMPGPGEPAPWFHAVTEENPNFSFDTVAGRRVVLCFFGELRPEELKKLLEKFRQANARLGAAGGVFFGISTVQGEVHMRIQKEMLPDGYLFLDWNRNVSQLYGVASMESGRAYKLASFVLDERLRVVDVVPLVAGEPDQHMMRVLAALEGLPAPWTRPVEGMPAPVLIVPRVFEPEFCQTLIEYYEREGGKPSGFMRDVDGKTVLIHDAKHKRRRDQAIDDDALRVACMQRIRNRLVPEIERAFQFKATRIERYIVACYRAEDAGHFRAHRDNTTKGTAHRKFAVSLNLNTGNYHGGMLRFPEFGGSHYQAPAGGAVVFSCSLLHEATPVTSGRRFAFLPFLYDDAAAELRERNRKFID